ncbi:uncharacterized protein LOC131218942 [Magnolia sinica]|uniref:uncharacterized protein LOC131218942 n=1 Tax=Magnolia sinica TaxID=86752 RepID=UPI00265AC573|nr:uncharacterized protein LOC131218942 [Magnolia sinica]
MFKSNGLFISLLLLLISSPNSPVFGEERSFQRPDPLQNFKPYNGDFNVTSPHYWASTVFTGVHGYAMAGVCILGGLAFASFLILRSFFADSDSISVRTDSYYFYSFLAVVLFTFLAIVASGLVLATNRNFYGRAKKLKQTLLSAAVDARTTIRKVTVAMNQTHRLLCPYDEATCSRSNSTSQNLKKESESIRQLVYKNRRSIDSALRISSGVTTGIVSANLALVIAALVMLLLHCRPGFIMIILICWILTALCWVITGFHFFIHTFSMDACWAFEEFKQNPDNNSLRSILPCFNAAAADHIMIEIAHGIHSFITKLNSNITTLDILLQLDEQYDRQSNIFRKVCDPFSGPPKYTFDPGRCSNDTIPIGDVPDALDQITCPDDNPLTGVCDGGRKFLSEAYFDMAQAYTRSIQGLLDVFPDLQSLTHCTFLKDTFADVLSHQCGPLKVSIRLLWSSLVSLSTIMMVLEIAWIAKACQDSKRWFSWGPTLSRTI